MLSWLSTFELERELLVSQTVSGDAFAQPLQHELESLRSRREASRVHFGNPDRDRVADRALRAQEQELPAMSQPAVSNHRFDVFDAVLARAAFPAVCQDDTKG
jgi:hypothetical protein